MHKMQEGTPSRRNKSTSQAQVFRSSTPIRNFKMKYKQIDLPRMLIFLWKG